MNETKRHEPAQQQQQASSEPVPAQKPERPPTGINPDMPDNPDDASGRPKGFKWGDRNCR